MRELTEIKSRDNEKLKFARRVRDGKEPDYMFVEGARLSGECLRSDVRIDVCFISDEFLHSDSFRSIGASIQANNLASYSVSEKLLSSIADTKSPQGVILIVHRPKPRSVEELFAKTDTELQIVVYLHQINNPSNLGAVIRTAEAAGVAGVIVSADSADPYSPRSLRASMGSAFRLPIVVNAEFDKVADCAKQNGYLVAAADAEGTLSHADYDWKNKTLLVFGSEADGLPPKIISSADAKLKIEMNSQVESLNLAVSCGIVFFEARRQVGA